MSTQCYQILEVGDKCTFMALDFHNSIHPMRNNMDKLLEHIMHIVFVTLATMPSCSSVFFSFFLRKVELTRMDIPIWTTVTVIKLTLAGMTFFLIVVSIGTYFIVVIFLQDWEGHSHTADASNIVICINHTGMGSFKYGTIVTRVYEW